ncbi:FGGY-family carbohydrate kinase, partial [Chloroflexota bacterium]
FELMLNAGLPEIKQVRISGGGAKSPVWRQIIADVLGVEIVMVNTTEGAAYGAALLAATGAGAFEDVPSACESVIGITGSTSPGKESKAYQDLYPVYRELYPVLKPSFNIIGRLVE